MGNTFKYHKQDCPCSFCKAKRGERKGINHPLYGKPSPMKDKHHSEETKKKMSEAQIGKKKPEGFGRRLSKIRIGRGNPMFGRSISEEHKSLIRRVNTGKNVTKETREKLRKASAGRKHSKKTIKKIREAAIKNWQNPVWRERQLKAIFEGLKLRPTKPEKQLDKLLQKLFLNEYKYVGDGSFLVGYKNPDFININGQKKIIEHFGYYHTEEYTGILNELNEQERIVHFAKYGYQTLIIWQYELEDVEKLKKKIIKFNEE